MNAYGYAARAQTDLIEHEAIDATLRQTPIAAVESVARWLGQRWKSPRPN